MLLYDVRLSEVASMSEAEGKKERENNRGIIEVHTLFVFSISDYLADY